MQQNAALFHVDRSMHLGAVAKVCDAAKYDLITHLPDTKRRDMRNLVEKPSRF